MPAIPLLMFPREQIEFAMEEAGYETPSKFAKKLPEISKANIPKDIKGYRHISYKESAIKERSKEMQEKFCNLQDEFGAGMVIEDIDGISSPEIMPRDIVEGLESLYQEVSSDIEERQDMELLCEKIKENFEVGSSACVTMGELAEKINKLVNKIINLEASVSSQAALIQRLRLETNELQAEIQTLEGNDILVNGKNYLREQLRKMEKFYGLQDLNQSEPEKEDRSLIKVESRETALNPDDSPEKHQNVKKKEHHKVSGKFHEDFKGPDGALNPDESLGVQQNLKSQHELKVSYSSEKEKETPTESSFFVELKEQDYKMNDTDSSIKTQGIKRE
ncbi:PROTEIN NETWORKED 2D [Salix viminalis]|uniref:PROTEIN NETWORKED 2D n=1 Tax=Salix viminalis TaxID=40686 RepID=A0A9Q0USM1_SALVM|nr:PROTEIN NETWORKED 2D [Salix viminalis]